MKIISELLYYLCGTDQILLRSLLNHRYVSHSTAQFESWPPSGTLPHSSLSIATEHHCGYIPIPAAILPTCSIHHFCGLSILHFPTGLKDIILLEISLYSYIFSIPHFLEPAQICVSTISFQKISSLRLSASVSNFFSNNYQKPKKNCSKR